MRTYPAALTIFITFFFGGPAQAASPTVAPLVNAHAHNDYLHTRPLMDALDHGFTSVEADVFPVDGKLLVGHTRNALKPERTLESLYLAPLAERVRENGGHVYKDNSRFFLLIDIKRDPQGTYHELQTLFAKYSSMLTTIQSGKVRPGAVTVVLTGYTPQIEFGDSHPRYAGIDGRMSDLGSRSPAHLMPMVSDNWTKQFHWDGSGVMPENEKAKLREIVKKAHASGRVVRFWATPEKETVWRELRAAGVDLINTDELDRLAAFLRTPDEKPAQVIGVMGKKREGTKVRGAASEPAEVRAGWLPERTALRLLVFVAGVVLMGLEIAGSRVLAPHFGNSVFVWGSLISAFLISLAVGYYIGGRLADRQPSMRLLGAILAAAAIWIFALASVGRGVCEAVWNGGFGLVTGPLVAATILFLPPSVALGVVSPFAVRMAATSLGSVGQTAGTLYALSTLGSIVGTLVTTFGLIPLVGVTAILRSLGVVLLLVSLVALSSHKSRLGSLALWIIFLAMAAGTFFAQRAQIPLAFGETLVLAQSTPYHDISVVDNRVHNSRQLRFDQFAETSISLTPPYATQDKYTSYFHLAFLARPEMERVLFIGAGGGVGPRSFLAHDPRLKIDVVDVDQRVLDLANDFFYLPKSPAIQLFAEDGRMFLRRTDTNYDCIVLDAFTIGGRIPFHLVTRECLELCRQHLTPNGVFVMNFGSTREGPRSGIYRSMLPTAVTVFANVYVFAVDLHTVDPQNTTNFVLLASDDRPVVPTEWLARAGRYQSESYVKTADVTKMVGDLLSEQSASPTAQIFTDDFAPIEMMAY